MSIRALPSSPLRLLTVSLVFACALAGCKRAEREAPPPAAAEKPAAQAPRTKEQAMESLLALPELRNWSQQIEKRSGGEARGAVIEDDPAPREINGKRYYQLSFVENRAEDVRRRESFLVAQDGNEILVEDPVNNELLSLQEWRRRIKRVELKSAD